MGYENYYGDEANNEKSTKPMEQNDVFAILAFIVSLLSIIGCCNICFLLTIAAVVLALIAICGNAQKKGFAIAAIAIALFAALLQIVLMIGEMA